MWLAVAEDQGVTAADAYVDKIIELCELIATQPEMGVERTDVADQIRAFPVDRYIIYYESLENELRVLRIWHSAQDPKLLRI